MVIHIALSPLLLLFSFNVCSKDLGIHGQVFEITEKDLLEEIQQKLVKLHKNGTLDDIQKQHALQAQKSIRRPKAVEGITRTKHARVWLHDPSLLISKDIKDHLGRIFVKAGTVINPLDTVKFTRPFLFLDGDDKEQIAWLKQSFKLDESVLKVILINGTPLTLSEELAMPVYFDQGGKLTQHFHIKAVPAVIKQQGKKLLVEEICVGAKK